MATRVFKRIAMMVPVAAFAVLAYSSAGRTAQAEVPRSQPAVTAHETIEDTDETTIEKRRVCCSRCSRCRGR